MTLLNQKAGMVLLLAIVMNVTMAQKGFAETGLEEIVVTAERVESNLQEVPIAVTAITSDAIERTDIHDLTGVALRTPSLTFAPFSPGQNIVQIRGVSSNDDGAGTEGSVALFLDDVYLGRVSNINFEFSDLERIEVLRGPQGTLYGRNAIGGAINVITKKPSLDEVAGQLRLTAGDLNRRDVGFQISIPFSDEVAMKFSAQRKLRDGWIRDQFVQPDNPYNDNADPKQDVNSTNYRVQLRYKNEDTELNFSFDRNEIDINDMGRVPIGSGAFTAYNAVCQNVDTGAGQVWQRDCNASPTDGFAKRDAGGASMKLEHAIDDDTLFTYIAAVRDSLNDWEMDSVGSSATALIDNIYDETEQVSHEFRFSGTDGDDLTYVVGLWLYTEETDRSEGFFLEPTALSGPNCGPADYNNYRLGSRNGCSQDWYNQVNETTSTAVFFQIDSPIGDDWSISFGARLTQDEKDISSISVDGTPVPFIISPGGAADTPNSNRWDGVSECIPNNGCFQGTRSGSWSDLSPKLVFSWIPDEDMNVYLSYTRGFKSGGFPAAPAVPSLLFELEPETADSYEFGVKADINDTTRINFAMNYTQYSNLQFQLFGDPSPATSAAFNVSSDFGIFGTFNGADSEISTIELEITYAPDELFLLNAGLTLNQHEFTSNQLTFNGQQLNGRPLPQTPSVKWNMAMIYNIPIEGGSKITASMDVAHVGARASDPTTAVSRLWAHTTLDLKLKWTAAEEDFSVSAWVNNATDEAYIIHAYNVGPGPQGVPALPRLSGVTFDYKF